MNVWDFEPTEVDHKTYADGTVVPGLHVWVTLNGVRVGFVEVHMHKNKHGPSFGATSMIYKDRIAPAWEVEG